MSTLLVCRIWTFYLSVLLELKCAPRVCVSMSCRNSSRFTQKDSLCVLRHKSNTPTHPKATTEQSEWEETAGEAMSSSIHRVGVTLWEGMKTQKEHLTWWEADHRHPARRLSFAAPRLRPSFSPQPFSAHSAFPAPPPLYKSGPARAVTEGWAAERKGAPSRLWRSSEGLSCLPRALRPPP